ncbi:hypothetical protein BGZ70_002375 [Mortierella alpina]|uniref:Subtilisin n=1 Tax=Mortierella alpina TaxID=64518 RepID=A0A9P6IVX2_MORAP|nr:hypothetical protein BGZ70_002375 [Mortierella alpina]
MKAQLILLLSIAVASIVLAVDAPGGQAKQAVLGVPSDLEAAAAVEQQAQDQSPDAVSVGSAQEDVNNDEETTEDDPSLHYLVDPSKKSTRGYDDDGRQEVVNIGPGMRTTADGQTRSHSGPRGRQRGAVLPHKYIVRLKNGADFSSVNIHTRVAERNRLQQAQGKQRGEQKLEQELVPNQVDHEYDFGTWKGYAGQFSSEFVKELETHDDVEYVEEDTLMWAWGIDEDSGAVLDKQEESAPSDASQEASVPVAGCSTDASNSPTDALDFDTSAVVNGRSINLEYFSLKAPSWGLSRIAQRDRDLAKDYSYMSSAGADVDVYIIDSGVYAEHSDFGGRAFNLANFVGTAVRCGQGCQYSPAGVKEAFAVGGSDRSDRVGWYSCTGQCVNIFAPGSGITSDWIRSPTSAHILDGTSMASPHVAGVAALFLGAGNTYSSAQGLYDDLVRLSTKGIISGLMTSDARTTRNLLYNKLEDLSAAVTIQPQDDLVALDDEQATDSKPNARKKTKKMRDENDRHAGRHHHHH